MLYRLIILTGPLKNQRITVDREPMTIGRAADCSIVLPDDEVAQKHAVLEDRGDGGLHLRDLGTMHKIIVNGREFRESRLKHGDMVEIGRTRFLVQAIVAASVAGGADDPEERTNLKLILALAAVVILAAVTWYRWPQIRGRPAAPEAAPEMPVAVAAVDGVAPAPRTNAPEAVAETPAAGLPFPTPDPGPAVAMSAMPAVAIPSEEESTQINDQIERMRADLLAMHEKIDGLQRPAETPPAETPPPPAGPAIPPVAAPPAPLILTATQALAAAAPAPVLSVATAAVDVAATPNSSPPTSLPVRPPPVAVTNLAADIEPPVTAAVTRVNGRMMRILNVEQSRFPSGEDFDDMRAFNVILSQTDTREEINNTDVRVDLSFYDTDPAAGRVFASRVVSPVNGLRPTAPWGANRRCMVSATYVLPKGVRQREKAAGHDERYYGFAVRVYYRDALQDEWTLPRGLFQAIAATNTMTNASTAAMLKETP